MVCLGILNMLKNKSFLLISIIILIFVGFVIQSIYAKNKQLNNGKIQINSDQNEFKDTTNGFSFKYKNNWVVSTKEYKSILDYERVYKFYNESDYGRSVFDSKFDQVWIKGLYDTSTPALKTINIHLKNDEDTTCNYMNFYVVKNEWKPFFLVDQGSGLTYVSDDLKYEYRDHSNGWFKAAEDQRKEYLAKGGDSSLLVKNSSGLNYIEFNQPHYKNALGDADYRIYSLKNNTFLITESPLWDRHGGCVDKTEILNSINQI